MRVTGAAVRFRWAVALPAGGVAFYGEKQKLGLELVAQHVSTRSMNARPNYIKSRLQTLSIF